MSPYGSTFAAYAVTVVFTAAGVFGLLLYDGAFLVQPCGSTCMGWNFGIVLLSTIGFTFVPWSIWRHLQPVGRAPRFAAPVAALTGLALSDLYLIAMSATGRAEPVNDQLFFMLAAAVLGGLMGGLYMGVERIMRRWERELPEG